MRAAVLAAATLLVVACDRRAGAAELSGAEIYDGACASCHGADGRGAPQGTALTVPLPDFTDCNFVTREGDGNWRDLVEYGGVGLGLSDQMPAFGDVLTAAQIQAVLDFIRTFCRDPRWPHGDLNYRRALVTGKAFPEDEALLIPALTKRGRTREWSTELAVERRVGIRGQVEVSLPFAVRDVADGATTGGVGDMTLAYTNVLYADRLRPAIVSAGLDLGLPTGDRDRGLGDGTVSFAPSLLLGTEIANFVLQAQLRGEAPVDEQRADRAVRYRFALSYPLAEVRRAWVPTIETEVLQNVTAGQQQLFVTPEIYKGLSQRGHLALAVGAQIPVAGDADTFDVRVLAFFLWEYADGGLWW